MYVFHWLLHSGILCTSPTIQPMHCNYSLSTVPVPPLVVPVVQVTAATTALHWFLTWSHWLSCPHTSSSTWSLSPLHKRGQEEALAGVVAAVAGEARPGQQQRLETGLAGGRRLTALPRPAAWRGRSSVLHSTGGEEGWGPWVINRPPNCLLIVFTIDLHLMKSLHYLKVFFVDTMLTICFVTICFVGCVLRHLACLFYVNGS